MQVRDLFVLILKRVILVLLIDIVFPISMYKQPIIGLLVYLI